MYLPSLHASSAFRGRSRAGLYGDTVREIDWSVGQILGTLRELDLCGKTLVIFTSDNGPWAIFDTHGGTAGLLRGAKGDTFEGGMREPTVVWGPGLVSPAVVRDLGSTLDLLPTFCALAGVEPPGDRVLDGDDLSPVLRGEGTSPRDEMIYYRTDRIFAARVGRFKAHFVTQSGYAGDPPVEHDPPLLYDLETDPWEMRNLYFEPAYSNVVQELKGDLLDWLVTTTRPATALGLGGVWISLYPKKKHQRTVRDLLDIPDHIGVLCALALGYPAEKKEARTKYDPELVHHCEW